MMWQTHLNCNSSDTQSAGGFSDRYDRSTLCLVSVIESAVQGAIESAVQGAMELPIMWVKIDDACELPCCIDVD